MALDKTQLAILAGYRRRIEETEAEIDQIRAEEDQSKAETSVAICGLNSKLWGLKRRAAAVEMDARLESQYAQHERRWEEQKTRALHILEVDLLRQFDRLKKEQTEDRRALAAIAD